MEFLSAEFLSALFAIIVIDLMLAGDNAIVIALAARNVPAHLQKRAILWGMAGAVGIRILMTLIVVWLLKIPGLLGIGGALLVWIAYRLLEPNGHDDEGEHVSGANTFWGAMRTIVIADAIMGLDNVLAVAGAAHGSFALVVIGLLISVPVVVWGSSLILRYVERYPGIIYFGAGVLAWTAVKMVTGEPLLKDFFAAHEMIIPLTYAVVLVGVLGSGFVKNHRHLEARIAARVAEFAKQWQAAQAVLSNEGEKVMHKILIPVDGSANSLHAVRHIVNEFMRHADMEIHLLNVQPSFSRYVARFVSKENRDSWRNEQAGLALQSCRALLEQHGVPYVQHVTRGNRAEGIVEKSKELGCDLIVMGTARKNSLTRMLETSVTNQVLELTEVPVKVVAGEAVSRLESFGVPAGIGACVAALLMAAID